MAGINTAMCSSFKQELMEAGHCLNAASFTGTTSSTSPNITSVSSLAGLSVGMSLSGTGVAANSFISSVSGTVAVMNQNGNANGSATITATGDTFNMSLFIGTVTGTWGAAATNYGTNTGSPSNSNIGTDELSTGSGYTAGGVTLTDQTPGLTGTSAFMTFAANPSWTSATFTTSGCMIYNKSLRLGTAGRTVGIWSFGGSQSVSSGTFTVLMPVNAAATALLQLN